ncbi:MAG TPA: FecR domain-containing protein [Polyangiaceae bacterium]|jgi:hypothetical protein|nr:FecR domain-containing protein [Polyangiaceae bacterium]
MNDSDDRADLALRRLGTSAVPVESAEHVAARRARLVPALTAFADAETHAERRPRWKRAFAVGVATAALAAGVAAFVVSRATERGPVLGASRGTVHVVHDGSDVTASAPRALAAADLLETLDGTAEVNLATGAVVELAAQSRLELTAVKRVASTISERVQLAAGRVSVRVPKLHDGSQLVIGTPDATVTVHGTAFTVDVSKSPTGEITTTVVVTEGRVGVDSGERHLLLGPGSHWSSAPRTVETQPAAAATSSAPPDVAPSSSGGAAHPSTLRTENELFRAAMAAERTGDPARALALTERLLRSYPDTPLAGEARALADEARRRSTAP